MIWNHKFSFIICFYHLVDVHNCHRILKRAFLPQRFSREQHNDARINFLKRWGERSWKWQWSGFSQHCPFPKFMWIETKQGAGGGWGGTFLGRVFTALNNPHPRVGRRGCFLQTWSQVMGLQWEPSKDWLPCSGIWRAWGLTQEKSQCLRLI